MILSNFHTHTNYSDGKNTMEEYIKEAIEKMCMYLGFSDHSPVDFASEWNMKFSNVGAYFNEIEKLKSIVPPNFNLYAGMEVDYYPDNKIFPEIYAYNPDYIIGAVHFMGYFDNGEVFTIDGGSDQVKKGLHQLFGGNASKLIKTYFNNICKMIESFNPDIIAHIDVLQKHNVDYFLGTDTSPEYLKNVAECLQLAKEKNCMIELNTSGLTRSWRKVMYPAPAILQSIAALEIPVVINADAHQIPNLTANFYNGVTYLKSNGINSQFILQNRIWKSESL